MDGVLSNLRNEMAEALPLLKVTLPCSSRAEPVQISQRVPCNNMLITRIRDVHVSQVTQLLLYLYALVGIGHHSDEEVNQNDNRYQHVYSKKDLKGDRGPPRLCMFPVGHPDRVFLGLAENSKKQQVENC